MAERCTTLLDDGQTWCHRTDTVQVVVGCVHEHVVEQWFCPEDLAKAESDDEMLCGWCHECSEPHDCVVRLLAMKAED